MSLLQLEGESVIKGNSKADMKSNAKISKWFEDNKERLETAVKTACVVIVASAIVDTLKRAKGKRKKK